MRKVQDDQSPEWLLASEPGHRRVPGHGEPAGPPSRSQQGQAVETLIKEEVPMRYISKKCAAILMLVALLLIPVASEAQLGGGIVYDPTNYHNALLRYYQLQQHLVELQKSYAKITGQLNLALQMAQFVKNMPARYRALFSQWRQVTSLNSFGNTVSWINGINTGVLPNINTGYLRSTSQLSPYSSYELSGMDPMEL